MSQVYISIYHDIHIIPPSKNMSFPSINLIFDSSKQKTCVSQQIYFSYTLIISGTENKFTKKHIHFHNK
jgi:hypothetical protein